jgi:hypothetical protein
MGYTSKLQLRNCAQNPHHVTIAGKGDRYLLSTHLIRPFCPYYSDASVGDEQHFLVTSTLLAALCALRYGDAARVLCVDDI